MAGFSFPGWCACVAASVTVTTVAVSARLGVGLGLKLSAHCSSANLTTAANRSNDTTIVRQFLIPRKNKI